MRVSNAADPTKSYYLIFILIFIGKSCIYILLKNTSTFVTHCSLILLTQPFPREAKDLSKGGKYPKHVPLPIQLATCKQKIPVDWFYL